MWPRIESAEIVLFLVTWPNHRACRLYTWVDIRPTSEKTYTPSIFPRIHMPMQTDSYPSSALPIPQSSNQHLASWTEASCTSTWSCATAVKIFINVVILDRNIKCQFITISKCVQWLPHGQQIILALKDLGSFSQFTPIKNNRKQNKVKTIKLILAASAEEQDNSFLNVLADVNCSTNWSDAKSSITWRDGFIPASCKGRHQRSACCWDEQWNFPVQVGSETISQHDSGPSHQPFRLLQPRNVANTCSRWNFHRQVLQNCNNVVIVFFVLFIFRLWSDAYWGINNILRSDNSNLYFWC